MANVTVANVLALLKDYSRNQNLTDARGIRTIDSATDIVFAEFGIPAQEKEYVFDYFEDQQVISAPSDFMEPISLRYQEDEQNKGQRFSFRPTELLFERQKHTDAFTRLWGQYNAAGLNQIYVLSKNTVAGISLESFDSNIWTVGGDAINASIDTNIKKEGNGSLKFDVDVSASVLDRASLEYTISSVDMTTMQDVGHFKLWVYIPNITNFSSISMNWGTSTDYYKSTVTTQEDGSAFEIGWNQISCPWLDATVVGTPNPAAVTYLKLDFDYTAAYVDTQSFRVDYLRLSVPDKLIMTYYSTMRGKNNSNTAIDVFGATTDYFTFTDPSVKQLIAIQAAILLNPQLLVDDQAILRTYKKLTTLFQRKYPKKKTNNLLFDPKIAKTS